jgi:serine/threonine-protein kinase RsbT
MTGEVRMAIAGDGDVVPARAQARALALELGFSRTDATLITTALSEIARNIIVHASRGEIVLAPVYDDDRFGLTIVARDSGPGIRDVNSALENGYASRGGLGLGLPGARRLMDEFQIASDIDEGTTVTMTKWRTRSPLERLRERDRQRLPGRE